MRDGTLAPIQEYNLKESTRVFGSRFVDELKKAGDKLRKNSRSIAQNYAYDGPTTIATKATTVQQFEQRVALFIEEYIPSMKTYTRDTTQAHIQ